MQKFLLVKYFNQQNDGLLHPEGSHSSAIFQHGHQLSAFAEANHPHLLEEERTNTRYFPWQVSDDCIVIFISHCIPVMSMPQLPWTNKLPLLLPILCSGKRGSHAHKGSFCIIFFCHAQNLMVKKCSRCQNFHGVSNGLLGPQISPLKFNAWIFFFPMKMST